MIFHLFSYSQEHSWTFCVSVIELYMWNNGQNLSSDPRITIIQRLFSWKTAWSSVDDVLTGKLSQYAAAELYNIPRNTIKMKVKRANSKHAVPNSNVTCIEKGRAGHPTVFSLHSGWGDYVFKDYVIKMSDFGSILLQWCKLYSNLVMNLLWYLYRNYG